MSIVKEITAAGKAAYQAATEASSRSPAKKGKPDQDVASKPTTTKGSLGERMMAERVKHYAAVRRQMLIQNVLLGLILLYLIW